MMENPPAQVQFQYPSESVRCECEEAYERLLEIEQVGVQFTIMCRLEQGRTLNRVKAALPHGQFGPWVAWKFPDWSESSVRRWRTMAERVDKNPELAGQLKSFMSTAAAEEFPSLPDPVRDRVIDEKAWTWSKYQAVVWDCAMRERLEDPDLDFDRRHGDVLHAIEDALRDPEAPAPLRDAAQELYEENRETFARLEGEDPAVVDVEVGIQWKEPDGTHPSTQLMEGENGYWLCMWDGEQMVPVAPVQSHVLMWNGSNNPVVLAAFPRTGDGPVAMSLQRAGVNAFADRLNATTLAAVYGGQIL